MGTTETPPWTQLPLLLRNLTASILIYALQTLFSFAQRYQLLETCRGAFLLFLRFVPSSFLEHVLVPHVNMKRHKYDTPSARNDTGIGRALSQLLSIMNDIPVSSRKYEVVRGLAERVMEENHREGGWALRRVNREVMSSAFGRMLRRVEAAAGGGERGMLRAVGDVVGWKRMEGVSLCGEKLGSELVWLAQRMAACGCGREAVCRWAAATNLGWLALSAQPRLQASLLKLAAFLFKEAKEMDLYETEGSKKEKDMQIRFKMLQSWLPLLCKASNGTDAPVLSMSEKTELERVLEETIEGLEQEEEQEQILSLWLHHFTQSSSSDWPNLHACYARWCSASRKRLLLP